jgi:hypothetical protein
MSGIVSGRVRPPAVNFRRMNTTTLRHALLGATTEQLGEVIDWLDRPWAPGKNDALRAAFHEARRSEGARRALAYALEEEIRSLAQSERDAAHVAARLAVGASTAEAAALEIARRLGAPSWPMPGISPEVIAAALRATAEIARLVLGGAGGGHHGRHRRSRRYRHGY